MRKLITLLVALACSIYSSSGMKITVGEMNRIAAEVNSRQSTWTAATDLGVGREDDEVLDLSHVAGVILNRPPRVKTPRTSKAKGKQEDRANYCEDNGLPKNFDLRKEYPDCTVIRHIYDQGNCGSCWAVATVAAFTDRLCIKTNGEQNVLRSTQQTTSCCHTCGNGCMGGWPIFAWRYLMKEGAPTGGEYGSKEGCQPYALKPCAHHMKHNTLESCNAKPRSKTPACKLHCYNEYYEGTYKEDRMKADSVYEVDPCAGQNEIYKNGTIVAAFAVYADFLTYRSGVYQHLTGKLIGLHAVRVIGWGIEKNVPYWLAVNSWNQSWGDKGVFKIIRGEDEVMFEEFFSAGSIDF